MADERGFEAVLYPRFWRWAAAALFAVSRGSLLIVLLAVLRSNDPPITPGMLAEALAVLCALPGLAAYLIGRSFAGEVRIAPESLVASRGGMRLEVPRDSIAAAEPWALPLPSPGMSLRLRSGRALSTSVGVEDPSPLLAALGEEEAACRPIVAWAAARAAWRRGFWQSWPAKYVLFSLPFGLIFFNADQFITYGGTFGQYYTYGLLPWLRSLLLHLAWVAMYLLLYAAVWRGFAELIALGAAGVAPSSAARVRRFAEIACLLTFYAGVPALVLLRFLD